MAIIRSYQLFISHSFKADDDYSRLREMIETSFSLPYSISSSPEDLKFKKMNKAGLEAELRKQILNANCFLALDGLYLEEDDWARYELEYAVKLGKPILAIRERKSKAVSAILNNVADVVLGWNQEAIMSAILAQSANVPVNFKR